MTWLQEPPAIHHTSTYLKVTSCKLLVLPNTVSNLLTKVNSLEKEAEKYKIISDKINMEVRKSL